MKYKTSLTNILVVSVPSIVGLLLLYLVGGNSFTEFMRRSYLFWVIIAVLIVLPSRFTYGSIQGDTFYFTSWLFSRKKSNIDDIEEILYEPAFKIPKGALRNYYIVFNRKNGSGQDYITIPEALFSKKVLASMFKDLISKNSDIKVDAYCSKLIQKA